MGKAITFIPLIVALGSILVFSEINLKDSSFLDMWRSIEWNSKKFIFDEFYKYNLTDWEFPAINISKSHISKSYTDLTIAISSYERDVLDLLCILCFFNIIGTLMYVWINGSTTSREEDLLLEKEIVDGCEEPQLSLDPDVFPPALRQQIDCIFTAEIRTTIAKKIINADSRDYVIAAINDEMERIMKKGQWRGRCIKPFYNDYGIFQKALFNYIITAINDEVERIMKKCQWRGRYTKPCTYNGIFKVYHPKSKKLKSRLFCSYHLKNPGIYYGFYDIQGWIQDMNMKDKPFFVKWKNAYGFK